LSKTKKQVNEIFGFKRPINQPTAIYGHFGKPNFPKPEDSKDAGIY
jgi:S-adenosylmethionine synthetase